MSAATEFAPGLMVQRTPAPLRLSDYKLIAFDMDSTLITIECIDEIADATGKKAEVAAITEATMRGEITDFKESLRQRVALLKGVTEADMAQVRSERLQLTPGAQTLVEACQKAGLKVLLVSGGFTYFAEHVRGLLNIDYVRAGPGKSGQRRADRSCRPKRHFRRHGRCGHEAAGTRHRRAQGPERLQDHRQAGQAAGRQA